MRQTAGDEYRIPGFEPQHLAGLEFQLDPAFQRIDKLAIASVVMPAGRLGHAGDRLHDLTTHRAAARVADAEIAIVEEIAPPLDHHRLLLAGETHGHRLAAQRRYVVCHRFLLPGEPALVVPTS